MTIRAVVDTSALFPFEQRSELQNLALTGAFIGIWSPAIIAELYRVLTWRAVNARAEALPGDVGKHAIVRPVGFRLVADQCGIPEDDGHLPG